MPDRERHFHFQFDPNTRHFVLYCCVGVAFGPEASEKDIVIRWPKTGYSREKALARADRYVGEQVRRASLHTKFNYTQETPTL